MKRIGLPISATLLAVGLSLSACSSGPPSKDDLSESLQENAGVPEDQADCVADKLLDSDLNDDQLNAIADDDRSDLDDDEEAEAVEEIGTAVAECLTP